jgi:hypothetical protein
MVASESAATIACAFDFRVDFDYCSRSEQLSGGAAQVPLNSARSA